MGAETERLHIDAAGDTDTVALELDGEDLEVGDVSDEESVQSEVRGETSFT